MHTSLTEDDPDTWGEIHGEVPTPELCTPEATLRRMDATGVERSVVWKIGRSTAGCAHNNDFVSAQAARYPDRFIPFAVVWPHDLDGALAEVDRAIVELGMAGVKLHPSVTNCPLDSPAFQAIVDRVAEHGVPFVCHVNGTYFSDLPVPGADGADIEPDEFAGRSHHRDVAAADRLEAIASRYDSPRFQAAHMGGVHKPWAANSTITFQTTGAGRRVLQWAVDNLGAERLVFGSDFPFFTVEDELRKIADLDISDSDRALILGGNAAARVL